MAIKGLAQAMKIWMQIDRRAGSPGCQPRQLNRVAESIIAKTALFGWPRVGGWRFRAVHHP